MPHSFNGFYLILFQYSNTILENFGLSILSKYSRILDFLVRYRLTDFTQDIVVRQFNLNASIKAYIISVLSIVHIISVLSIVPQWNNRRLSFFCFSWQEDFKLMFIDAGLLIKQRCTKPIRG